MQILETERLILRDWQESDAEDYCDLCRDPALKNASVFPQTDLQDSLESIRTMSRLQESWAVTLKENGRLIGQIFLSDVGRHPGYRELEYAISADYRRQGFGSEAVRAVLKQAFTGMGLLVVAAGVYTGNTPSMRLLEKCGFACDGTLRRYGRNLADSVRYSILKEEWEDPNQ